jgi:hypothetical protein
MSLMSGVSGMHRHTRGPKATGHVSTLEPSRTERRVWSHMTRGDIGALPAVVLVPRSHGDTRAFLRRGRVWSHETHVDFGALSYRVTGSVPQGMWQHRSPFLVGGVPDASGHVTTPKPFPGRWCVVCHGARGDIGALSWRVACSVPVPWGTWWSQSSGTGSGFRVVGLIF